MGSWRAATGMLTLMALVGGCRSPVPFHGRPGTDAPVPAIAAPMPYVRPPHRPTPLVDQGGDLADPVVDVYAATRAGSLSPAVRRLPRRVYVPDGAGAVDVVDATRYRLVRRVPVGRAPRQVVPSWDLRTLWVIQAGGLVPIDPRTGVAGRTVPVAAPADLYFSVDGRDAFVLDGRSGRIEVRDPHTMRPRAVIRVPCAGLTHADLSADGATMVVGCAGGLARVDLARRTTTGTLRLAAGSRPQDVRLSPDGTTYYVADAGRGGVWLVDAARFRETGFVPTGRGAAGLYPSRAANVLYVTDGGERTVSLISFASRRAIGRWRVPARPVTGGVSAGGKVFWLSTRGAVYAISTRTGRLLHRVAVGPGARGLCVHPQPGRFSLGHTGIYR